MSEHESEIRKPGGAFAGGETEGHGDRRKRIRRKDGLLFRGEELGYIDRDRAVRKRDGLIFRGDKVAQIEEGKLRDKDGLFFRGDQWGYVDKNGSVWRKGQGFLASDLKIGEVRGDPDQALAFYALKFGDLVQKVEQLEREAGAAMGNPQECGRVLARMRGMLKFLPEARALGDFDKLTQRLTHLVESVERSNKEVYAQRAGRKKELIDAVRRLASSSDWHAGGDQIHNMQAQWKQIGYTGAEDERLWSDFRGACDVFYSRRKEFYNRRDKEWEQNRAKLEEICAAAEALARAGDTRDSVHKIRELQEQWKAAGPARREDADKLWQRFRRACDDVFQHARETKDAREREWQANRRAKEVLIDEAQRLARAGDVKGATGRIKELQEEWKAVGQVRREEADDLWKRFRNACDEVYDNARQAREVREREWDANHRAKEALIDEAERLAGSSDMKYATGRVKELQEEWKGIGQVRREDTDDLWRRFRRACDAVFEHAREDRERRSAEWREHQLEVLRAKREQVTRLEESVEHDESNVERWRSTLYNLRPGGRAAEIAADLEHRITDVENRIGDKRSRIAQLERIIDDIESRLSS